VGRHWHWHLCRPRLAAGLPGSAALGCKPMLLVRAWSVTRLPLNQAACTRRPAPAVPPGRRRPTHAAQAARAPRLARPRTFSTASALCHNHTLTLYWRRRSFDVLPDGLGGPRSAFPHTLLLAAGTQAATAGGNSVVLLKLSNLTQGRHGSRVRYPHATFKALLTSNCACCTACAARVATG